MIYVIYHASCPDGFSCAWLLWKKYQNKAIYFAANHGDKVPTMKSGAKLFIVDYSYPLEQMKSLIEKYDVTMIDHHISAQRDLASIMPRDNFVLDLNNCASMLTFKYLYPQLEVYPLLYYVQDLDLWQFKMPASLEIAALIKSVPFQFEEWERLHQLLIDNFAKAEDIGKNLLRNNQKMIASIASHSYQTKFEGYTVPAVSTPIFNSEVGNYLLQLYPDAPFSITWFMTKNKKYKLSLRSNNKVDLSLLAQKYKGGGHKNAAGLILDCAP